MSMNIWNGQQLFLGISLHLRGTLSKNFNWVWAAPNKQKRCFRLAGSFLFYGSVYTLPMLVSLLNPAFHSAFRAVHFRYCTTKKITRRNFFYQFFCKNRSSNGILSEGRICFFKSFQDKTFQCATVSEIIFIFF